MNSFQIVVLGIFAFFIVAGLAAVAVVKQQSGPQATVVTLWGSVPDDAMQKLIKSSFNSETLKVVYREIPEGWLDREIIEALAARRGPDMLLLPLSLLTRYKGKLIVTPFTTYTERTYRDNFIQEGDLFLSGKGIYAFPFLLDPLVMYYNRDLLDDVQMAQAPKYWDEFIALAKNLSIRDESGNISRSAVALGAYQNVRHAREILSAMLIQSGNPIVSNGPPIHPTLDERNAPPVLDFYTEFSNPQKPVYSWNRSLPNSRDAFLSSDLGIYFGFASDYEKLRRENPNLDFDIAAFPRPRNASVATTYGKLTGIAILNTTGKSGTALQVALTLTGTRAFGILRKETGLPPVHRGLLAARPTDAFGSVMYDSAFRARGFLDPNPAISAGIFKDMIESVTSGRERSKQALQTANGILEQALR